MPSALQEASPPLSWPSTRAVTRHQADLAGQRGSGEQIPSGLQQVRADATKVPDDIHDQG